jgi:hypothetical protein
MKTNKIRKGSIVVVINGLSLGNHANTITKIIHTNGIMNEDPNISQRTEYYMCEALEEKHSYNQFYNLYCNKPFYYELKIDVRLANEEEKKLFTKNNCKPICINF